jgi:2-polyprenyl-6-methoxyphenol hydroxylase-like FAD-dependent oxidoreductase
MTSDVLVMGGGATGQLAAAYLRMRFPNLKVAVVEGPHKHRPIVGESFVEITVDFLLELGLGAYLIEKQYPKYGLTYYSSSTSTIPLIVLISSTRLRQCHRSSLFK